MKKAVIIVAGGSGSRMAAPIPKQFMLMNGKPILMHTLQRFYDFDQKLFIVLVLPDIEKENWLKLVREFKFPVPHTIVNGGDTRYQSVKNGLEKITWPCTLAIQDGVRPLCSIDLISRCFKEAAKHSNAIPAIPVKDSYRLINGNENSILDRSSLRIIQTPQCFDSEKLKRAYRKNETKNFTDDAGVFEMDGNTIHLVEGESSNIKITLPEDLLLASALEKKLFHTSK